MLGRGGWAEGYSDISATSQLEATKCWLFLIISACVCRNRLFLIGIFLIFLLHLLFLLVHEDWWSYTQFQATCTEVRSAAISKTTCGGVQVQNTMFELLFMLVCLILSAPVQRPSEGNRRMQISSIVDNSRSAWYLKYRTWISSDSTSPS